MLKVTGAQLRRMIKHILRDEAFAGHTEFYQFSRGVKIVYSRARHEFDELSFEGEPLCDGRLYSIGLQKFHYANIADSLDITIEEAEKNAKTRVLATSCRDVLDEYLTANPQLDRKVEGRLNITE